MTVDDSNNSPRSRPFSEYAHLSLSIFITYILPTFLLLARISGSLGSSLFGTQNVLKYIFGANWTQSLLDKDQASGISVAMQIGTSVTNVIGNGISRPYPMYKLFNELDQSRLKWWRQERQELQFASLVKWIAGWDTKEMSTANNIKMIFIKFFLLVSGGFVGLGAYNGAYTLAQTLAKIGEDDYDIHGTLEGERELAFSQIFSMIVMMGMVVSYIAFEYRESKNNAKDWLGLHHNFITLDIDKALSSENAPELIGGKLSATRAYVWNCHLKQLHHVNTTPIEGWHVKQRDISHSNDIVESINEFARLIKSGQTNSLLEKELEPILNHVQLMEFKKIIGESAGFDKLAAILAGVFSLPFFASQPVLFMFNTGHAIDRLPQVAHQISPVVKQTVQFISGSSGFVSMIFSRYPAFYRTLKRNKTEVEKKNEEKISSERNKAEISASLLLKLNGFLDACSAGLQFAVSIPNSANEIFHANLYNPLLLVMAAFVAPSNAILTYYFNTSETVEGWVARRVNARLDANTKKLNAQRDVKNKIGSPSDSGINDFDAHLGFTPSSP